MPLPDFIIGGAPKCGTTSLFQYLGQHPEVYTSTPKEPHFFAGGWQEEMSREEYEKLFEEKGPQQKAGEGSTWYLNYADESAPKIAKIIPQVRLIFLVRNPVDRDYSDYWFHLQRGSIPLRKSFSHYVSRFDHWIFDGSKSYISGLKAFYSHFREDQILVLLTADLRENCDEVLRRVCSHIGVTVDYSFDLKNRHNVTKYPLSVQLCRWIGRIAPGLSKWTAAKKWFRGLRSRLLFSTGAEKPSMRDADRRRLAARYKEEIEELEDLIGRDLSQWREPE